MKPVSSACTGAAPSSVTAAINAQRTAQFIPAMLRRTRTEWYSRSRATPSAGGRITASVNSQDRKALHVKSIALAATLTATVLCGVIGAASSADADPLNPRDPDYCGNSPDILRCAGQQSTYPNPAEMAYLNAIRGKFPPGSEAPRLAAGRAACLEFPKYPTSLIIDQVGVYLQLPKSTAGDVVDSARANICPSARSLS